MVRIQRENSRSGFRPARWVSSRWVWVFTRPGTKTASGNSTRRAPGGSGTSACGATPAILPSAATRTAPSVMGGAVTGWTAPARMRSIQGLGNRGSGLEDRGAPSRAPNPESPSSRRQAGPEWRVHRAGLCRLRAGIEPIPVPHLLRAERRREIAVRPIHFTRDQRVGAHPVGRRGPAIVHVAHERGPGGRDDAAAAGVVLEDPLLDVVADPDPGHQLGRVSGEPGVRVVVGGARLGGAGGGGAGLA